MEGSPPEGSGLPPMPDSVSRKPAAVFSNKFRKRESFFAAVSVTQKQMLNLSLFPNRVDFPKAYSFCYSQIGSISQML